jgi:dipeptidyl aminopeptidase/acylaminoacyl peptidase
VKTRIVPTEFSSEGEILRGNFVLPNKEGVFPGICKFHGLPGSSDQIGGIATRLAETGFAVLTFDFRGFRASEGRFSLAGELKDARAAIHHLIKSGYISPEWIGIYGASYGAAVAVLEATQNPLITAVALRAPVSDTLAFAQSPIISIGIEELLRTNPDEIHGLSDPEWRQGFVERMIQDARKFNPMDEIHKLAPCPLFIITGNIDRRINLEGVKRLFEAANEPKEMVVVPDADHNLTNPAAFELTMDAVVAWFLRQFIHGDYLGI